MINDFCFVIKINKTTPLFQNGHFYTASDSNTVQVHTFPDGSPDGLVTRFTAPVTHMCFNESGSHLLAGSR